MSEVFSFGLYFQSTQRIQLSLFIILLRLLVCALNFDKALETPVTDLMERKGQLYPSVGLAQGYRNGIQEGQRWNVSPHGRQHQSLHEGWLTSAKFCKSEHSQHLF